MLDIDTQRSAMFQIVYLSKAIVPFSAISLTILLRKARDRNRRSYVTGMLVYSRGEFEGEPAAVIDTFSRISEDPRHHQVITLRRAIASPGRDFKAWSMGFKDLSDSPRVKGGVPINDRILLSQLDEISAVDFLKTCSESQTDI
jgi:hypothetical protein